MGKGSSSSVTQETAYQQQTTQAPAAAASYDTVTPAIAKSIAADTDAAQARQLADRQRMRGISSTYLRGAAASGGSGKTKLGQ